MLNSECSLQEKLKENKMATRIFKFKVKFSLTGILEVKATRPMEAEEIVGEMSDREIEHLAEYHLENMEVTNEPELIEETE